MKRNLLREHAPEWTTDNTGILICPCGHRVEDDGECPNGHTSPLRDMGLI